MTIRIAGKVFEDTEGYELYCYDHDIVDGKWQRKKEHAWKKQVNGLCASDYSQGEQAYENTCGDGVKCCSKEESDEIDKMVFGSDYARKTVAKLQTNEAQARKATPLYSGVRVYFPDALEAIARVSLEGNKQHKNGDTLHWDRSKSKDEYDSADRHLNDRAKGLEFDIDGHRHMAKAAWRCLAALQKEIEAERRAEG